MDLTHADRADLQRRVDGHPFWYHTIDIAPGVATPGWFDLRTVVDKMPWPDVKGKRCLDIGTFDGYLAFELERRGASEVVAVDVEDHLLWDWPSDYRAVDLPRDPGFSGPPKGDGFRLARDLMGSKVDWRPVSVYDLDPSVIGKFDVVLMGTLLLHLRDPIRALEAVRSVTDGYFLSAEQIEVGLTLLGRRRPLYTLNGSGGLCQWFNVNLEGHKRFCRGQPSVYCPFQCAPEASADRSPHAARHGPPLSNRRRRARNHAPSRARTAEGVSPPPCAGSFGTLS
jgi:tRNA (mo5U34)-methyltransferase